MFCTGPCSCQGRRCGDARTHTSITHTHTNLFKHIKERSNSEVKRLK